MNPTKKESIGAIILSKKNKVSNQAIHVVPLKLLFLF